MSHELKKKTEETFNRYSNKKIPNLTSALSIEIEKPTDCREFRIRKPNMFQNVYSFTFFVSYSLY